MAAQHRLERLRLPGVGSPARPTVTSTGMSDGGVNPG